MSNLTVSVPGENRVSVQAAVSFIKLLYRYEQWDMFCTLSDHLLNFLSVSHRVTLYYFLSVSHNDNLSTFCLSVTKITLTLASSLYKLFV